MYIKPAMKVDDQIPVLRTVSPLWNRAAATASTPLPGSQYAEISNLYWSTMTGDSGASPPGLLRRLH